MSKNFNSGIENLNVRLYECLYYYTIVLKRSFIGPFPHHYFDRHLTMSDFVRITWTFVSYDKPDEDVYRP